MKSDELITKLYQLFLSELEFVRNASLFTHQELSNPKECGVFVEAAFRKLLKEVIGERFHVTHGYILSPVKKETSPQVDIIIVDKLVPHTFKKFEYLDGLEVVPAEAVVGIFEVKRTLHKDAFEKAQEHLEKIIEFIPTLKNNNQRYLPGGIIFQGLDTITVTGGKHSNPLIGILGLDSKISNNEKPHWFIDVVCSSDGLLIATKDPENNNFKPLTCRNKDSKIEHLPFEVPESIQITYKTDKIHINAWKIQMFVAFVTQYLNEITGRMFNVNDYLPKF